MWGGGTVGRVDGKELLLGLRLSGERRGPEKWGVLRVRLAHYTRMEEDRQNATVGEMGPGGRDGNRGGDCEEHLGE